jgi:hypothetical protein
MRPRLASNDRADLTLADSIVIGYRLLAAFTLRVFGADREHLLGSELSAIVLFSWHAVNSWKVIPSMKTFFCNAVLHVLGASAEKQMRRANAPAIVAAVAGIQAIRNGAECKFVGESMGSKFPASNLDTGVSAANQTAGPIDTGAWVFRRLSDELFQQSVTANLMAHLRALHGSLCMALAAFARCGAFSILPQNTMKISRFLAFGGR